MTRPFKILAIAMWAVALLATVSVVLAYYKVQAAATGATEQGTLVPAVAPDLSTKLYPAPAFALVDENEKTVTEQTFKGQPWIAAFIFTNCSGTCPMMSSHMTTLQEKITTPDVRLVSFTLDPERDTPAVLKSYARKVNATEGRWFFLTGSNEQMQAVARGMKIAVEGKAPGTDQIIHSSKFLLVDRDNTIRGIYDGTDAEVLARLAADAEKLAKE